MKKIILAILLIGIIGIGLVVGQGFYGGSGSNSQAENSPALNNIIILYGNNAASMDYQAARLIYNELLTDYNVKIMKDSDYRDDSVSSVISVGGSCVNKESAVILNTNYPKCGRDFTSLTNVGIGKYLIKTSPLSSNRIAILVAGYEAEDTWKAAEYLLTQNIANFSTSMRYIGSSSVTTPTPTPSPQTYSVSIQNFAFSPASLSVKAGDSVTWTNMDSAPHTVTSDSGSELNSPTLQKGDTYQHTFNNDGTFSYFCTIHPNMRASVSVA